jgi:hypothetical protein
LAHSPLTYLGLEGDNKVVYLHDQQSKFPDDVKGLRAGDVISASWNREFATAKNAVTALNKYLKARGAAGECVEPTTVPEERGAGDGSWTWGGKTSSYYGDRGALAANMELLGHRYGTQMG